MIGLDARFDSIVELQGRLERLEKQARVLRALLRLTLTMLRVCGVRLEHLRVTDESGKRALLFAVARARQVLPLGAVLKVLHLSSSRYHEWVRAEHGCDLTDHSSCPQVVAHRLTASEILCIKTMALATEFRHMSIRALALHAQRIRKVFAHPNTWSRLIRQRGWRRPRLRVYPAKPKVGVRASAPNEVWHVDTTIIRLLDGTRAYLHAVIDNYSRKILAWTVAEKMTPESTYEILQKACTQLPSSAAKVFMDSGVENINKSIDAFFEESILDRVLAQVDVTFSNSMIEAWWRSLRHQWLYLHTLDSVAAIRRLTAFYVQQHNEVMPHAAFSGQTPDEMFRGDNGQVPNELTERRAQARHARFEENRRLRCGRCPRGPDVDPGAAAA